MDAPPRVKKHPDKRNSRQKSLKEKYEESRLEVKKYKTLYEISQAACRDLLSRNESLTAQLTTLSPDTESPARPLNHYLDVTFVRLHRINRINRPPYADMFDHSAIRDAREVRLDVDDCGSFAGLVTSAVDLQPVRAYRKLRRRYEEGLLFRFANGDGAWRQEAECRAQLAELRAGGSEVEQVFIGVDFQG